jgi:hypothetical protein
MANTTTAVLESLKYTYGTNRVLYLFNQESVGFNILSRVKKPVGGRGQFILPVIVQNPGAFTGISEGGSLPTPLDMDTAEATFKLHEYVATYNITWKLIQDSRTDKFAFQQAVQMLDEGLRRRVMRNLNSDLIDDGRGRLAVMSAVDDGAGLFTSTFLPRLEKGMKVDIMSNSDDDTKRGDSLTVSGVDPVALTVQLSGAVTGESAGDYAVIEDTTDISINSLALHSNGLLGVINSANPASVVGNYGGFNRSTAGNEFWKSVVLSNSGTNRPLTEDLLLQALDGVRVKGGGKVDHIISNLPIVRRYHEMLAGERYFALSQPGTIGGGIGRKDARMQSEDGKTPYEFSGVPWHVDPYFQNNRIVGLDSSHFFLGVGDNDVPRPISEIFDDVPFFKQTTSATFEVNWYYQMELLSDNPAAGFQVQDVAEA